MRGTAGEGTGLGLAIADEIARLHGTQLQLGDAVPADDAALGTGSALRKGLCVSVLLATAAQDDPAFTRGLRVRQDVA